MPTRRELMLGAGASLGVAPLCANAARGPAPAWSPLLTDLHRRTVDFFWQTSDPATGLAPDRWPTKAFSSIAAIGFALTAYPIGVANGWIDRAAARTRTLNTLRFLWSRPQGPERTGVAGYKGFFYHFLDARGLRFGNVELSTIDTALLLGGVLFAGGWFDADHPDEAAIRDLAAKIYGRCDWRWFQDQAAKGDPRLSMGWHPESGFIERRWNGYTEAMLLYVLALGAGDRAIGADAWAGWCATYGDNWRGEGETRFLAFAPHFGHQYSHVWIDFRGIRDAAMRAAGLDYFENSRRATYAQRAYAIANPGGWAGYGRDIWGLTACDGPGSIAKRIGGRDRQIDGYHARGPVGQPDGYDDGTLAPTAAAASLPFAPEIVVPAIAAMKARYGSALYGKYGFLDAFNPTLTEGPVEKGRVVPGIGWVDDDYLGIDQGPIAAMLANHRSDTVWATMRKVPAIRDGLVRAGFTGGWLR